MIINERGLVRNIKQAYKRSGYTIISTGDQVTLFTEDWYVRADWDKFPRKALAAIVECMGMLPATSDALAVMAGEEPQVVMPEVAGQDVASWETGEDEADTVTMVPVLFQGYQLYQVDGGGACYGVVAPLLSIVERDVAQHKEATRKGERRLYWSHDGELVILGAVRPTGAYWEKDWVSTAWAAMETVDLHRKE